MFDKQIPSSHNEYKNEKKKKTTQVVFRIGFSTERPRRDPPQKGILSLKKEPSSRMVKGIGPRIYALPGGSRDITGTGSKGIYIRRRAEELLL